MQGQVPGCALKMAGWKMYNGFGLRAGCEQARHEVFLVGFRSDGFVHKARWQAGSYTEPAHLLSQPPSHTTSRTTAFPPCRFIKNNLIVEITSSASLARSFGWLLKRHTIISFYLYCAGFVRCVRYSPVLGGDGQGSAEAGAIAGQRKLEGAKGTGAWTAWPGMAPRH